MEIQLEKINQHCFAMYRLQGISHLLQEIGDAKDETTQAMYAVLAEDLDGIADVMREVVNGPES